MMTAKQYKTSLFSFELPEEWPKSPDPDLSIFRSPDGRFSLTISVRPVKSTLPREQVAVGFSEMVRERRAAEMDVGKVFLSEEKIVDEGWYLYSKYAGIHVGAEPSLDRRFAALLTAQSGNIFTFYIEAVESNDAEFNSKANTFFDSIEVA